MIGPAHDLDLLRTWMESTDVPLPAESRDDLALRYFVYCMLFNKVDSDTEVHGCSFSQRGPNILLVVKATVQDIPQVAYVTERSPIRCVVIFARLWLEGRVKWHPDRYSSI